MRSFGILYLAIIVVLAVLVTKTVTKTIKVEHDDLKVSQEAVINKSDENHSDEKKDDFIEGVNNADENTVDDTDENAVDVTDDSEKDVDSQESDEDASEPYEDDLETLQEEPEGDENHVDPEEKDLKAIDDTRESHTDGKSEPRNKVVADPAYTPKKTTYKHRRRYQPRYYKNRSYKTRHYKPRRYQPRYYKPRHYKPYYYRRRHYKKYYYKPCYKKKETEEERRRREAQQVVTIYSNAMTLGLDYFAVNQTQAENFTNLLLREEILPHPAACKKELPKYADCKIEELTDIFRKSECKITNSSTTPAPASGDEDSAIEQREVGKRFRNRDGSTTEIRSCLKRRSKTRNNNLRLCSSCVATTILPADRFPRFLNEHICTTDTSDTYCLSNEGSCYQDFAYLQFRRDTNKVGSKRLSEWPVYQQKVRTGCSCQVFPKSIFFAPFV